MKTDTYARYAIQCADGRMNRHSVPQVSVRYRAIEKVEEVESRTDLTCGPHTVVQQIVVVTESDYGPMTDIDPRTASMAAWTKQVLANPCPRCEVPAEAPCENLTKRAKGVVFPTVLPHPERVELTERVPDVIPVSVRPV